MQKRRHIQHILVRGIALTVLTTLVVALVVSGIVLSNQLRQQASEVLSQSLDDALSSGEFSIYWKAMESSLEMLYNDDGEYVPDDVVLHNSVASMALTTFDIVNKDGTIVHSSDRGRVGLSYYDDQQTKAYIEKSRSDSGYIEHVDSWPLYDNKPYHLISEVIYLSTDLEDYDIAVMGMNDETYGMERMMSIIAGTNYRRVGEHGYLLSCNSDLIVTSSASPDSYGQRLTLSHDINQVCDEDLVVDENLFGEDVYLRARRLAHPFRTDTSNYLLAVYPQKDVLASVQRTLVSLVVFCAVLFVSLVVLLSRLSRRHVSDRVAAVNASLATITSGELSERVSVTDSMEFEDLSNGINATVTKLEDLIRQEATRLDEELALARTIQKTALPNVFPPFPERQDVGLFASMDAAREVGGDFYDFFPVSNDRVAVLVADVSDKGIPAAMFMMRAKTTIKAHAVSGLAVDEIITRTNDELVEDNEAGMFVTVWLGILDLGTGIMQYVHAGHTCPVLLGTDGVSFVQKRREFIVGARSGITYHRQELRLRPGDAVFLYSDGVTEAFDADDELYGSERLADVIAQAAAEAPTDDPNRYCEEICRRVREDVDAFSAGMEQSDDITTLCVRYEGRGKL